MFKLQANRRLRAADERKTTNMRELAESTLRSLANDASDSRQHLAQRELDRRAGLDKKKKQEDKVKDKKPNLLTRTKEGTEHYIEEHNQDIASTAGEYIKYAL